MNIISKIFNNFRDFLWGYPDWLTKRWQSFSALFYLFGAILTCVGLVYYATSDYFLNLVKAQNSETLVEGAVGQFENSYPLIATDNQVNRDIYELVFNRLIALDSNGEMKSDVASKVDISEDGLIYTVTLKEGYKWHDGEELTAKDVKFTYDKASEIAIGASGDTNRVICEVISDYQVRFSLSQVNAAFLESLSFYILPEHILSDRTDREILALRDNEVLIGSDTFRISSLNPDRLLLTSVKNNPKLKSFEYRFYPTFEELKVAFQNNKLDLMSVADSSELEFLNDYKSYSIKELPILTRRKTLFINNERISDLNIRKAINYAIDKESLIKSAEISARVALGTYPETFWTYNTDTDRYLYDKTKASERLNEAGYKLAENGNLATKDDGSTLKYNVTYLDNRLNRILAEEIALDLKSVGIDVQLRGQDINTITNESLARRDFDMLLFETENSIDPDRFEFYHSTNSAYPNLNISQFNFGRVDILLERAILTNNRESRQADYKLFDRYLMENAPVVFLYYPSFTIVHRSDLDLSQIDKSIYPENRMQYIEGFIK